MSALRAQRGPALGEAASRRSEAVEEEEPTGDGLDQAAGS